MSLRSSLLVLFLAAAPAAAQDVLLKVEADKPGAKIDRHIFGQFAEHLGHGIYEGVWVGPDSDIPNTRGIRNDVVAALKAIKVPNIRWPGGCFADEYHWRGGIGPKERRRAMVNTNWGGVIEPNTFGTHEFFDFIEQVGADAYVSVNVGSGTVQEAAEWMEYMTAVHPTALAQERVGNGRKAPFQVPFVGLGNENWGCGGAMSADYYVDLMKAFARYTRNYDPDQKSKLIAVGPDGAKTEYTEAVMKAWSERVWSWTIDGLSLHNYTLNGWPPSVKATGFGEPEYAKFIEETLGMDTLIRTHSAIMDKYDPEKEVALVVDEWGAWLAPAEGTNPGFLVQQNSMRDAILAALNLNIFARHAERVRVANIAQMVNVLQAMILTDKEQMLLTPTYHVFHMYVPFQDAAFVPVAFDKGRYTVGDVVLPRVDAIAAKAADGTLWVAVTNVDAGRAVEVGLEVAGFDAASARGLLLTAPRVDAVNTFEAKDTVAPRPVTLSNGRLQLPPHSVAVVGLKPR
ncbi:alpha-N-arabinofuranosidase [Pseudoxanthomonas broegbernensis]|uniref:non-reducing end alpha-L-arabinofuranosidase n=1 Tax=Pseudoxanthomonas broegbernensis TaxID=83619 RepID=A0A7V8GLZ7_9GAMM|nr:alpha-L-arabinofuranosidase C-terminal domain-containing protein [Pseudoxanthomonas broegbernensis]KAF1686165.1 alpha-N-arabinofuranosidase [Pseudoxanthomonas broegbernensis]MBB6063871.1 alpha-N-arabinofuranosidase [Pseudoxanthomonas broegbernensis]